ncbi:hypothetical protein ACM26V_15430 [Salipaludibacillus sp. HK11]|uniref:hypothetical protein n=1 Tax=Salipaludibacillus sp. HK11 TaxID=3394320 RepID=UPI0039FC7AFF
MAVKNKKIMLSLVGGIIGGTVILFFIFWGRDDSLSWTADDFNQIVKTHYLTEDGLIRSYGIDSNDHYLSESSGLYMKWLQDNHFEELLKVQISNLSSYFLVEKNNDYFLSWEINNDEEATANAWIDDIRIIDVLGSENAIALKLVESIKKYQIQNGMISDFYDWKQDAASDRVVLSYGSSDNPEFNLPSMDTVFQLATERETTFFPEQYKFDSKKFEEASVVHMVDQLLIAIELEKEGESIDKFWTFLINQWNQEGIISGRFDREGLEGNMIESGSVYGIASKLAQIRGEDEIAGEWKNRGIEIVYQKDEDYSDVHFFDLIWIAP